MWCRVSGGCRAKIEVASGVMSSGGTTRGVKGEILSWIYLNVGGGLNHDSRLHMPPPPCIQTQCRCNCTIQKHSEL